MKRNLTFLISLVVLASMILAACGGGPPATEAPPVVTEPPEATEPAATETQQRQNPQPRPNQPWGGCCDCHLHPTTNYSQSHVHEPVVRFHDDRVIS